MGTCDELTVTVATNLVGFTAGAYPSVPHNFQLTPSSPGSSTGTVTLENTPIALANFNFSGSVEPGEVFYTISALPVAFTGDELDVFWVDADSFWSESHFF